MEVELHGEYKGWKITHDGEDYNATKDEREIERMKDLDKLKRRIDKMERHAGTKFKRTSERGNDHEHCFHRRGLYWTEPTCESMVFLQGSR